MRHLLLVTAYWPPRIDSGTHRWAGLAPRLAAREWRPVVLTPSLSPIDELDERLAAEVADVEVWRAPPGPLRRRWSAERTRARRVDLWPERWGYEAMRWLRRAAVFPDGAVDWVPTAVRYGARRAAGRAFDVVISSGPPASSHIVGAALARASGARWVADHRDPWTFSSRLSPVGPIVAAHETLRRWVAACADGHLAATEHIAQGLEADSAHEVLVVRNGADPAQQGLPQERGGRLRIAHVGVLHRDRHQPALWEGLAAALRAGELPEGQVEVDVVGPTVREVEEAVGALGLERVVTQRGVVDHREAVATMQRADVLLLLGSRDPLAHHQVPAKLYEYLVSGALIVGAVAEDSEPAALLNEAGHWVVGVSPSATTWQQTFARVGARFVAGERTVPVSSSVAEAVDQQRLADRVTAHLAQLAPRQM